MRFRLTLYCLLAVSLIHAQPYAVGDKVVDFPLRVVLNESSAPASLAALGKEITILDFFGTWCAPCIRALPVLATLREKFKGSVAVVLISVEEESQLKAFIEKRRPFAFPLVVDIDERITNRFKPPSYPYTVVLNANREVLAITDAASLTEENIRTWLQKKNEITEQKQGMAVKPDSMVQKQAAEEPANLVTPTLPQFNPVIELSRQFIYASRTGAETAGLVQQLASVPYDSLLSSLPGDREKKAFWINLYNGFTQVRLTKDAAQYSNRSAFYGGREMVVAGHLFSLDDIEHGILRRSSVKWSLGYLNKWFPRKIEKQLRVDNVDWRIHFALNCGAKSCPPIASYDPAALDKQLDLASKAYLTAEASYDSEKNSLALPALMGWFRNDFGGKKKMVELLQQLTVVPPGKQPRVEFKKYDWTLYLNNYTR